jgi:hypothetical protein
MLNFPHRSIVSAVAMEGEGLESEQNEQVEDANEQTIL